VAGVEVVGNKVYTEERLRKEIRIVVGAPLSRSVVRADVDRLRTLYAREGYIDAEVNPSIVDLPKKDGDEQVRVLFTVKNEGDKVYVNRIVVNGVTGSAAAQQTKREAIARSSALVEGELLRADRINEAERALYATDAFSQVTIHSETSRGGERGIRKRDVINRR